MRAGVVNVLFCSMLLGAVVSGWQPLPNYLKFVFSEDEQPLTKCCACGTAKYRLTFQGLWNPQNHPKGYPRRLAYFSPLIGVTHTPDLVLWRLGSLATEGIKRMSEYGSSTVLEKEIRLQGARKLSLIRTSDTKSGEGVSQTSFYVDQFRHLLSAISRISPSPDWNVGVDSIDLCDFSLCQWKKKLDTNLLPWDAGTDSGITFTSPNQKTLPPQPIHLITTKHGNHSQGSFYLDEDTIPPLAKINLQLESVEGQCGGQSVGGPSGPELDVRSGTCLVSKWSSWTRCSVSCGSGLRVRGRAIIRRSSVLEQCPSLREVQACHQNPCPSEEKGTNNIGCVVDHWGAWTPCNVSCGKGKRVRTRNVIRYPSQGAPPCPKLTRKKRCHLAACPTVAS